jgi:hypothetical protein
MNINNDLYKNLDILLNISKNEKNINSYNGTNIQNKKKTFITLLKLTERIEEVLFKKVLLRILYLSPNHKKTFDKDFNLIFNIFKKIYEARDTKSIFKSNNLNSIRISYSNYILKFILSLDDKEFDFIENLLQDNGSKINYQQIFRTTYKKYKHTQSKELYKALSKIFFLFKDEEEFLNVTNTILNPQIKKNKYIIIPDDNASNLKKLYFILLVVISSCIEIIIINIRKPNLILFLKKILLNYKKNTISKEPSEEIQFAIVLGCLCDFKFSIFIDTISNKIIQEKKTNKTNINTRVKSSKDISDLFEIFLELNINNSRTLNNIVYYQFLDYIISKIFPEVQLLEETNASTELARHVASGTNAPLVMNDPGFNNLFNSIKNSIDFFSNINKITQFRSESLIELKNNIELINTKKYNELRILKNDGSYILVFELSNIIKTLNTKILIINKDIHTKNIKGLNSKEILIPNINPMK